MRQKPKGLGCWGGWVGGWGGLVNSCRGSITSAFRAWCWPCFSGSVGGLQLV